MSTWYPGKKVVKESGTYTPEKKPNKREVCLVCNGTGERVAKDVPGFQDGEMRPCVACKDGFLTPKSNERQVKDY